VEGKLTERVSAEHVAKLEEAAYQIRRLSLEMITYARWGHPGGSLSMAEILSVLYFHIMNIDADNPDREDRDRLILSKAHASPALYAALALKGFITIEEIYTYCEPGGLEGHTDRTHTPGVEASGGPLGMGLSVAVGCAYGLRLKENPRSRVFCVLGDGELNEGNIWEAAMSAAHFHLDNLIAIVDYNKVMAKGFVWDLMNIEPLIDKWSAFGWDILQVDGHDIEALCDTFYQARWIKPRGKPLVVIAHTVKGRGVEIAEFNYKWHTHAPEPEIADQMLRALSKQYHRPELGYSRLDDVHEKESFYGGE
jgi:transketolase